MKKLFLKSTLLLAVCGLMFVCCDKDETSDEKVTPDDEQVTPDDEETTDDEETPDDQDTPDVEEVCYDVFFPEQDTEFTFASDAEETVADVTVCRVNTDGEIEVPVEITQKTGGVFELSELAFADGEETVQLTLTLTEAEPGAEYSCTLTIDSEYAATDGSATELTVTFTIEPEPEPDYSITVSNVSVLPSEEDPEYISATVTLGEDVEYAVVALVAGTEYDAASVEAEETLTETGTVELALPEESGTYSVVAVAYADGEVKGSDSVSLTYTAPEPAGPEIEVPDGWTLLGMAEYTDVIMVYVYSGNTSSNASETYEVPILESESTPGLYRLVNPYGQYYPHTDASEWDADNDYYFEIDATTWDEVYFNKQDIGAIYNGNHIFVETLAAHYVDIYKSTIAREKDCDECGTLVDNVITFPADSQYDGPNMLYYSGSGDGPYKVTTTAQFKIVLP